MPAAPEPPIHSLIELAAHRDDPALDGFRACFSIDRIEAVPLSMNEKAWRDTERSMQVPREAVVHQELVVVRDLHLGSEALLNPLRGRRAAPPAAGPDPATIIDQEREATGCRWCDRDGWHVSQHGMWDDAFGAVRSADGRVCARGNWARQAPVSGVVFGDERMHNLLRLERSEFLSLFDVAERYVHQARSSLPEAAYFLLYLNGGYKSAGSVAHAHLQVVGRADRHFAYAERIAARCPHDYWPRLRAVHEQLGLAFGEGEAIAWASLVPEKERDVTALSSTVREGADCVYRCLQRLYQAGTNSFSLMAILSPAYVTGRSTPGGRFAAWPPVVWRFLDRGDMRARHTDIGGMELFGSTIVATDPFEVSRWLSSG